MSKQDVYIVSELFYPETISTGYIMTEIAAEMAKTYNVKVICGPEYYEKKDKVEKVDSLPDIDIFRIKSNGYNKNKLLSRVFGNFLVSFKLFQLMKSEIPSDSKVLMVTNPIFLLLIASFYSKSKKWKINLLVHDVFPENLLLSNVLKSKNFIFKILEIFFNRSFKKMHSIIVLGRDMKAIFQNKVANKVQIHVIENWADTERISASILNEQSSKNLLFAGNLGRLQGIDSLLSALYKTRNEDYTFTFIGNGAFSATIDNFIKNNNLSHIEKLGWIERSKQNEFLANSTIGVVTLKKGMVGLGVPSKFYNLLAAGKPILYIGDLYSELYYVLKENNIGWFVESGSTEMICTTIMEIINTDFNTLRKMSLNARNLSVERYDKKIVLSRFVEIFKD
ncbi:glycosyltransferase involved in cell wall biosynthesis [Nonlabens dokdonensis]|uniref:Glycosyltransferase involved in cell wall biosynthesis n=2 Tax=Nonlabens dokdonensis TaxID=328515 RepID=A0ABX5PWK1_9FLAO|nr:glycosyltransferase family 4 protein [Nonlabens dokdonensis]AGC78666.1 putative glycosyltransferase [Nonlabens dokdonensis DSW-6]PZX39207.1 glycosyltransferase involved in cell wall biosynthesis [Nonlabens dokdonensis]